MLQNTWTEFDVHVTVHRDKLLTINQLDALISQISFWKETLHVSDSSSVHHQDFVTVHTQHCYVLYRFADSFQDFSKPV